MTCSTKYCRRDGVSKKGGLCHRCYQRKWRESCPRRAYYFNIKDHAKERKIKCPISMKDFIALMPDDWQPGPVFSADRIDATRGYEVGNIQFITLSENIAKGNRERYLPEHIRHMVERRRGEVFDDSELVYHHDDSDPSRPF